MAAEEKEQGECDLDFESRIIYLTGDITPEVSSSFRRAMKDLNKDNFTPITVEINSKGGSISAGLAIIDTIRKTESPVITRCVGEAESIAALILAVGNVREALPNSVIMVHEGSYDFGYLTLSQLENEMTEARRLDAICNDILSKATNQERYYWECKQRGQDVYMDAYQAKAEGLIDTVLE